MSTNRGAVYMTMHEEDGTFWAVCNEWRGWVAASDNEDDLAKLCRESVELWGNTREEFRGRAGIVFRMDACIRGGRCNEAS